MLSAALATMLGIILWGIALLAFAAGSFIGPSGLIEILLFSAPIIFFVIPLASRCSGQVTVWLIALAPLFGLGNFLLLALVAKLVSNHFKLTDNVFNGLSILMTVIWIIPVYLIAKSGNKPIDTVSSPEQH